MLKESLTDYRRLFQTIMDTVGGIVFAKDKTGKYLFVNKAYGKDFKVDPKDVVGKDDFFIFSSENAETMQANDRMIMAEKNATTVEESGFLHGKYTTYLINKAPIFGDDEEVLGTCGVGFDITRQKEMEKELNEARSHLEERVNERTEELSKTVAILRETEKRYRTVADFTYDWEYWFNIDGSMEYVSPSSERISGYTPQQFMDNSSLHRDIIVREDREVWDKHFHDARSDLKIREIQFRIRCRDGAIRWIEHACQPVIGGQGEGLGYRASNRDITDRKVGEINLKNAYSEINALKEQLEIEQTYLREEIKLEHDYENIIGNSDALKYVLFRTEQVAKTDTAVLILGETGTGKELIARAIHSGSSRQNRPLIKLNCASLSANLIESELFGHEKGAFTGALEKRIGRFELANEATIFLDEIGELPLELQSKLLRVLQDGEFERLGSSQTIRTNVRVIAATNRNLEEEVHNKKFRMDLWYRLSVYTITIPPLRERKEDIGLLVNYLVGNNERKLGKKIPSVSADALTKLQNYSWPGNIRELENVIERAAISTHGNILQLEDSLNMQLTLDGASRDLPIKSLEEIEREHILLALRKTNWKIHGEDGAASLLHINPSTLRGRMRKHEIQRPPYKI